MSLSVFSGMCVTVRWQGLGLLINMVEHCDHNRALLLRAPASCPYDETSPMTWQAAAPMAALEAITRLFLLRYEAAKRIEVEHDEEMERREAAGAGQRHRAAIGAAGQHTSAAAGGKQAQLLCVALTVARVSV